MPGTCTGYRETAEGTGYLIRRKAVIFDTYVSPRMDCISVADMIDWHRQNGLKQKSAMM